MSQVINAVDERYFLVIALDLDIFAVHDQPLAPALAVLATHPAVSWQLVHFCNDRAVDFGRRHPVLVSQLPERHAVNVGYPEQGFSPVVNAEGMLLLFAEVAL